MLERVLESEMLLELEPLELEELLELELFEFGLLELELLELELLELERRQDHHENDELVAAKTKAAVKHGLIPIICVGETSDDLDKFGASAVPVGQLRAVLAGLAADSEIVVAYEPVWAIGSGQAATPTQAQDVCAALRAVIAEELSPESAQATRILYGGSVKSGNIASFMREKDVDGALVGGASLDAEEFAKIVQFPRHVIA
jgi:triosephosphate isomerase